MAIKNGNNYRGILYNFTSKESTVISGCTTTSDSNREPAYLTDDSNGDASLYNKVEITEKSLQNEYNTMIGKVEEYGGFYIGRYETSLSDASETSAGTKGIVQSKAGILPISVSDTNLHTWYGLYSIEKTYTGTNKSVQSSMMWGSQYDAMLNWIQTSNSVDKNKITAHGIGNHGDIVTTGNGSYSNDSINNIRDLEGNIRELTLEACGNSLRVQRGASSYPGESSICRNNYFPTSSSYKSGSRISFYIH